MGTKRVLELKERLGRAEQPAEVAGGRWGSPRVASGLRPRLGAPGGGDAHQVPLAPSGRCMARLRLRGVLNRSLRGRV